MLYIEYKFTGHISSNQHAPRNITLYTKATTTKKQVSNFMYQAKEEFGLKPNAYVELTGTVQVNYNNLLETFEISSNQYHYNPCPGKFPIYGAESRDWLSPQTYTKEELVFMECNQSTYYFHNGNELVMQDELDWESDDMVIYRGHHYYRNKSDDDRVWECIEIVGYYLIESTCFVDDQR